MRLWRINKLLVAAQHLYYYKLEEQNNYKMKRAAKAKGKKQPPSKGSEEKPKAPASEKTAQQPKIDELCNFDFLEVMGKGAFGRVYKVYSLTT